MSAKLWTEYRSYYNLRILGYVDLTCCVIVVISNLLVILVFTRRKTKSAIVTIFIHIAINELLGAVAYAPRAFRELIGATLCSIAEHRTYVWEHITLYSFELAHLFRTVTVWMAFMLGVWRYIAVIHPLQARIWCTMKITRKFIVWGYIFGIVFALPPYFSMDVREAKILLDENGCSTTNVTSGQNTTIYEFQLPLQNHPFWYNTMFLSYAILKIVPSLIFAAISYKLIKAIIEANRIHENLTRDSYQNNRTTIILLFILLFFVIGEVPNGIGVLFNVLEGPTYFWDTYYYSFEIFNCLTHISASFNLAIYYIISNEFRRTFKELFTRTKINYPPLNTTSTSKFTSTTSDIVNKSPYTVNFSSNSRDRYYNSIPKQNIIIEA